MKLGAFATVCDEAGRVLLAQRRTDDFWMQPGGGVEAGEAPWQAVVREVREETGLDVTVERLAGIYCWPEAGELIFSFVCSALGDALEASDETRDVCFFAPDELPATTFAEHRERIAEALAGGPGGIGSVLRIPTGISAPEEVRRARERGAEPARDAPRVAPRDATANDREVRLKGNAGGVSRPEMGWDAMSDQQETTGQGTSGTIRAATPADLPAMLALAAERRARDAAYQPLFWRPAADAEEAQAPFFEELIADPGVLTIVHERAPEQDHEQDHEQDQGQGGTVDAFLIAMLMPPPPVYDPGGPTCSIDDFWVAGDADWQGVGRALLEATIGAAKAAGAVQVMVVCAHLDESKRAMLGGDHFSIASEWWVRDI